jgi:hypothetical protein
MRCIPPLAVVEPAETMLVGIAGSETTRLLDTAVRFVKEPVHIIGL